MAPYSIDEEYMDPHCGCGRRLIADLYCPEKLWQVFDYYSGSHVLCLKIKFVLNRLIHFQKPHWPKIYHLPNPPAGRIDCFKTIPH